MGGRKLRVGNNKLAQSIKESAIEKAKERKERLDRETSTLNVGTRNQPKRKDATAAAADVANDDVSDVSDVFDVSDGHESESSFLHESSEAIEVSSDDSDDYILTDARRSMDGASDTEMQPDTDSEQNQKRMRKAN